MQIIFKPRTSKQNVEGKNSNDDQSRIAEEIIVRSIVGLVYAVVFWFIGLQGTDRRTTMDQATPMLVLFGIVGFLIGFIRGGTNMLGSLSSPDIKGGGYGRWL